MYNSSKQKSQNRNRRKYLLIIPAVIVFIGLSYYVVTKRNAPSTSTDQSAAASETIPTDDGGQANLDPGTDEDQATADDNKANVPNEEAQNNSSDKKTVTPEVTFAGKRSDTVQVTSYISEVYEATGSCTATFKSGSKQIIRTVEGIKDATYTRCDRVVVDISEFGSSSDWTVTILYDSPTARGTSEARKVPGL